MITIEETDDRFYIDTSLIPNAGRGVFAKRLILKDERLKIIGILVKLRGVSDQCTEYSKWHRFKTLGYNLIPMGYGGMVNHAQSVELGNVKLVRESYDLYYQAVRNIFPNEEILSPYCQNYDAYLAYKATDDLENIAVEFRELSLNNYFDLGFLSETGETK